MARRRRVELTAIASLDADIARVRQRCDDQVQLAYERLAERQRARRTVHDAYLECLRPFYEAALVESAVDASAWPATSLQAFLGRYFVVYRERDAFASLCAALEAEGARWEVSGSARCVAIESFDVLKQALRRDTATRMVEYDASALEAPVEAVQSRLHGRERGREEEELVLPRLTVHGKRSRPTASSAASRNAPAVSSSRSSISAIQVSESDVSSEWFGDEDGQDEDYSVPTNSVVIPTEFSTEVIKKSRNWFGRWRTRHLYLRWNELEMRAKSGTAPSRHGAARSFPSQPAMSALSTAAIAPPTIIGAHSSTASVKTKRYALQNLISIQLIQLNESEPSRRHAIDIHFKQTATNGHGHTTKSLILGSEKGVDALKKVMSLISTLALFRGLVAGEKAQQLQQYVQSGANVNAFCTVPSQRIPAPMNPLQLVVMQCYTKSDVQRELRIMKMLLESKADARSLLHWHFARRTLLSAHEQSEFSVLDSLLPPSDSTSTPVLQMPLTGFGSDEHGWTLLMFLSVLGGLDRVNLLLSRIRSSLRERDKVNRYLEHVNGNGDTALHIAIKASRYRRGDVAQNENVALAIASFCWVDDTPAPSSSSLFYISDANGQTVMHLAIKAKMWRLVAFLLEHRLFDLCTRDDYGNNALHLMIKVGAPLAIFETTVQHFTPKGRRASAGEDLDSPDQMFSASPLLLSIQRRREDYVKALLEAGAVVPTHSSAEDGVTKDHGHDTLLHIAIRMGLVGTAQIIWQCTGPHCGSSQHSTLSLAVRFGMYRLAYNIIHRVSPELKVLDKNLLWLDAETGYSMASLAIIAGQFELAALMIDVGGDALFTLHHKRLGETALHSLMLSAMQHQSDDSNNRRLTVRPSHSKSLSDGDLLNANRLSNGQEDVWKTALACSTFRARVIEEMTSYGLLALPNIDILTIACKCTGQNLERGHVDFTNRRISEKSNSQVNEPGELSSLMSMASAFSHVPSSRFLVLLLAIVRIKCVESSATVMTDLITAQCGQPEETSVFIALTRGLFHNALVLLHYLLPNLPDGEGEQVGGGYGLDWMEAAGTTLLHIACERPNDPDALMIVDLLLHAGAYSGCWDREGFCPLHLAIQHRCDKRMIQLFRKYDQDLNVWSDATNTLRINAETATVPMTPLMTAVQHGNAEAFRELILCGAEFRLVIPAHRLGLLQFAARCTRLDREVIHELTELNALLRNPSKDAYGMSSAEAAEVLRTRLEEKEATHKVSEDNPVSASSARAVTPDAKNGGETGDNTVLRITLLGLQTSESRNGNDIRTPLQLSPATGRSFHPSPPRSPSASSSAGDSARSRKQFLNSARAHQEPSLERGQTPPPSRHPFLEDSALGYLQGEEKATLTLIAHEARNEAQEWLNKRSGQKKLLSEARAQLQVAQSHRRTGSGTIVQIPDVQPLVTDAQLLETYKALAAKQFVDTHVAAAVADARMLIEREKRAIFQETGVYPGEIVFSSKAKENSVGSTSSASARETTGMHRSASINSSMMLLSSRSNDFSDPGNDSSRGGVAWWADHGEKSCDDEGTFLGELSGLNGTWLSSGSTGPVRAEDGDDVVMNPLDCEAFVHVIEKRKSMD